MPRLLVLGHVTWDKIQGQEVLGGTVSYASLAARKLGWEAAVLTAAGADFDPGRDLRGVTCFVEPSDATTRFQNLYDAEGNRRQVLVTRAAPVTPVPLPDAWRDPDVLLLGPVAGELSGSLAGAFRAAVVGAVAQGWLRKFDDDGSVSPREWDDPKGDLLGVHALFFSQQDLPDAAAHARGFLSHVPIVALTRGWEGSLLYTRDSIQSIPTLPREEVDPTGAGDVFAAAFLMRYHETKDSLEAAVFASCAASCVVEGLGTTGLGDRAEIEKRIATRARLIEEGEWDE